MTLHLVHFEPGEFFMLKSRRCSFVLCVFGVLLVVNSGYAMQHEGQKKDPRERPADQASAHFNQSLMQQIPQTSTSASGILPIQNQLLNVPVSTTTEKVMEPIRVTTASPKFNSKLALETVLYLEYPDHPSITRILNIDCRNALAKCARPVSIEFQIPEYVIKKHNVREVEIIENKFRLNQNFRKFLVGGLCLGCMWGLMAMSNVPHDEANALALGAGVCGAFLLEPWMYRTSLMVTQKQYRPITVQVSGNVNVGDGTFTLGPINANGKVTKKAITYYNAHKQEITE